MKTRHTLLLAAVLATTVAGCSTDPNQGCVPSQAEFTVEARRIVEGAGGRPPNVETAQSWAINITDTYRDPDGEQNAVNNIASGLGQLGIADDTVARRTASRVVGAAHTELCLDTE